jgi:methionine-rich copper-binding protein CopC
MRTRLFAALAAASAFAAVPAIAQDSADENGPVATTPADGAELAEAPASLELTFAGPVTLDMVALTSAAGSVLTLDVADVPEGEIVAVPLPELGPGAYTVIWRAVDAGGSARSGSFSFSVG